MLGERRAGPVGERDVLTIVGLPIGISLEVLQALQASSPRDLAIGLAAAFAITGACSPPVQAAS